MGIDTRTAVQLSRLESPTEKFAEEPDAPIDVKECCGIGLSSVGRSVKGGVILGHGVSKFRGNVRLSVQQKCHSVKPQWYQMMTFRKPRGIVALADPQRPCIS